MRKSAVGGNLLNTIGNLFTSAFTKKALLLFTVLCALSLSSPVFADITFQGNLPGGDTGAFYIAVYNDTQSSPCSGTADSGETKFGEQDAVSGDTNYSTSDTDYSITFSPTADPDDYYIYYCNDAAGTELTSITKSSVADGTTIDINIGRVTFDASSKVHTDLNSDYVFVCNGTTKLTTVNVQVASQEYNQYYPIDEDAGDTSYKVYFDDDTTDPCTVDNTKSTGKTIDLTASSPDNYGVYVTFSPDTKVTGDLVSGADLNAAQFYVTDANGYSVGWAIESYTDNSANPDGNNLDDDYTIYYDKPASGDVQLNISSVSNGYTIIDGISTTTFTGAGSYDFIEHFNDGGDGAPSDITSIEVACNVNGANAPDDDVSVSTILHDTKLFDIYMPLCSNSEDFLFKKSGTLVFNKSSVDISAEGADTVDVAKISGSVHSGIGSGGNDQIQIHTAATCTAGSVVSSETVYGNTTGNGDYEIYFEDTDVDVYMSIAKDGTYTTCGNKIAAATFGTDQTATINLDVEVAGTVPSGIDRAAIDAGTASDATDASTCAAYSDVSSGKYYIYGTTSSDSEVTLGNSGNVFFVASGALATELLERTKDLTTDQTVNVARVNGTDSNINSDFYYLGSYNETEVRVSDEDTNDGTDLLSSETVYIDASRDNTTTDDTYTQYFEVPTDGYVNIVLYNNSATVMYVYNFSASAGGEYTFEPKYKVAATVHSDVSAIEIWQTDNGGYRLRDVTGESNIFNLYVDKTEEGQDNDYTYRAYDETTFATLLLARDSKDVSSASAWGVSRLTGSAHANLQETNAADNIEVYEGSDCATTLLSSENIAIGSTYYQYFEADGGGSLYVKVTDNDGTNEYVTCVNIEDTDATKGESISYNFNQLVYGNVPSDINYVAMDNDGDSLGWEYYQTPVTATTPDTFKIYTNGTADTDVQFKSGGSSGTIELTVTGQDTTDGEQINVGKVSGNSLAVLSTVVVYNTSDCSTGQLSSESEDPGTTYSQYFEDDGTGTFYISVGDGTNTTCLSSGFMLTNQEASGISFNRTLSGTVPDQDSTTSDILSVALDTGDNTYWSNTVNGASTNSYKIYVDSVDTSIATTDIVFKNTAGGTGTTLLSLTKDLSSDATADVSCVYGNRQTDIQGAGEVSYVCYGTLPTSNQACSSRASTVSAGAGSTYELFFEQISGTSIYFVEVADSDTQTYYSWNNFTSSSAGSYVNVELDGKLSGYVQDSNSDRVPGVQVSLYTNGGDPTDDRVSLTFTYPGTTSPGGNYRMYGDLTTTYDVQFTKAGYITNTNTSLAALTTTYNPTLENGIKVTVQDQGGNPINDATVAIYGCGATNDPAQCNYAGAAIVTSSSGTGGVYYLSTAGITNGYYVGIKVSRTNYTTQYDPSPDAATNDNQVSSSSQITETFNLIYSVELDTTRPTVANVSPTTVQTDTTPTISVKFVDETGFGTPGGVNEITFMVDGNSVISDTQTLADSNKNLTLSYTPTTPLTDDAWHSVFVKVMDDAGNEKVAEWIFKVDSHATDTRAPTVASFGPTDDQTDRTPTIYIAPTDDVTANGSLTVELSVNGESKTMTYNPTTKRWEFTPTTNLTDADYTEVYVKVQDEAGNWIARTWSFYVNSDDVAPTMGLTIWPAATETTEPFWIGVEVANETGLTCEYYIISNTTNTYADSGDLAEINTTTNSYGIVQATKIYGLEDDDYTLTFTCEDAYGNSDTLEAYFTVAINAYNYTQWLYKIWDKLWLPDESIMTNMTYSDFNITTILNSIDGYYEEVYYYDGSSWAVYSTTLGWSGSDLQYVNNTNDKPYWIKLNTTALGTDTKIRFTM